jgi:hypothetical protein
MRYLLLALLPIFGSAAASPDALRVYHFGNSLTGVSMPAWHPALGASAGKTWTNHAWLGAGWQLWQHREELAAGHDLFGAGPKGDLTLDANLIQSANLHRTALTEGTWDAVVLQLFAPAVSRTTDTAGGKKLGAPRDVGDLGAASDLIAFQLRRNPASRVFLYQVWPQMDPGTVPPREQQPAWAQRMTNVRTAEFPNRTSFDYEKRWLQPYDPNAQPSAGYTHRTRDFSAQVFSGLQQQFPELVAQRRLRLVPAGDLFLALDRRYRAGVDPGIADIREFYTDVQHIRAGLPRYAVAALLFACLFETPPDRLDWSLYNNSAAYGPDPHHDSGELLPLTASRVALVHATIASLLSPPSR